MIVSGGFNVFPREIEDVLSTDPSVSTVAVIGVPDEKWGEAVKAVVVARPGAQIDAAALIALVKEHKGPVLCAEDDRRGGEPAADRGRQGRQEGAAREVLGRHVARRALAGGLGSRNILDSSPI